MTISRYGITSLLAGLGAGAAIMTDSAQSKGQIRHVKTSRDQKMHRKSGGSQNYCSGGCGRPISANRSICLACKAASGAELTGGERAILQKAARKAGA